MDPQAALDQADLHFTDGEFEECAYCLANYFRWRIEHGFEPTNGDHRATVLLAKLGQKCDRYATVS